MKSSTTASYIPVILLFWFAVSCSSVTTSPQPSASTPPTSQMSTGGDRADGARRLFQVDLPASAQNPAFSADGQTILFTLFHEGYNEGPAGLYLMPRDGGKPVLLLDESGQDSVNLPGSSWNAAANRIAFSSDREDTDEIWTISPDGGSIFRVTQHTTLPTYFIEPSFSPDGQWIVFEANNDAPEDEQQGSLWKVRADGSGLTQLTGGNGADDRQPNWSPRGDRILFQHRMLDSDNWNLFSMAIDGSDIRQVTDAPSGDTDASWSPDGRWIVYSSDYGGLPTPNIFVVSAEGGMPLRVTSDPTHEDGAPSWSPDGKWIAFESHTGADETAPASLWIIAAPDLQSTLPTAQFQWPDWAYKARIAGAFIDPADPDVNIDTALDALAAQNVSVIIADSPWGWSYSAWVDDAEFQTVRGLVVDMVKKAHARGLKVVMYQTGLELTAEPGRDPGLEHPDWAQVSLDGQPILFNDIGSEQEHWLDRGEWDFWASPCSGYLQLSLKRVRDVAATGVDGLWVDTVYLQDGIGSHEDLWASTDTCSAAAFRTATGLDLPREENWDDPAWLQWVIWRYSQTTGYLSACKDAAQEVNPNLVFFEENWNVDTSGAMQYANDPALYLTYPDISTGHEVSTIGDRVDEGETGMAKAGLEDWLSFRTMIAFARAADRSKPSWILTYGYQPRDSAQLAGMILAEGANFYETQGPGMAETVGEAFRTGLFGWIKAHETDLYPSPNIESGTGREVGLVFSPRNRDLLDRGSGDLYDSGDATHFAAYRDAAALLYMSHIPFDIVLDSDTGVFDNYAVLILPEVQMMSDSTVAAICGYRGKLLVVGDIGIYDEWLNDRPKNTLDCLSSKRFGEADASLITAANTGLLMTDAPPEVQIGFHRTPTGYALVLVNTDHDLTVGFNVDLRLAENQTISAVHLSAPDGAENDLAFTVSGGLAHLNVPAGIDTFTLITLAASR